MKPFPECATVIGDLVGSRTSVDRAKLHSRLQTVLTEANALIEPVRPLRVTVGDEFQGTYTTVGDAVRASLLVRIRLLPEHDVRHGIGWGTTTVLDDASGIEDGPGWWAARAAIETVSAAEDVAASRTLRTAYARAEDANGPDAGLVNAALVLRDERVSTLSDRSLSVLRGLLSGQTQRDIAAELGVSASAVSQRVRADGLAALVTAHDLVGGPR